MKRHPGSLGLSEPDTGSSGTSPTAGATPTTGPTATHAPTAGPTATGVPAATPTTAPGTTPTETLKCPGQKTGDYDCDGTVVQTDFQTWQTDFTANKTVIKLFEYWRQKFYDTSGRSE